MKIRKSHIFVLLSAIVLSGFIMRYAYFGITNNHLTSAGQGLGEISVSGMTLTEEVSVTGKIKSTQNINLAFEKSGKISKIFSKTGDKIKAGQKLIVLENNDISSQVLQAQAGLKAAQAKLSELKNGARPEDISLAQTLVTNSQNSLSGAKDNLVSIQNNADMNLLNQYDKVKDIINDVYIKANDAILNKTYAMFSDNSLNNPKLIFYTRDTTDNDVIDLQKVKIDGLLSEQKDQLTTISSDPVILDSLLTNTKKNLNSYKDFLSQLQNSANLAIISSSVTQTQIDAFKVNLSAAQNEVQLGLTTIANQEQAIAGQKTLNKTLITTAESAITNAENALKSAKDALILKQSGSTSDQIDSQEAQVESAQAALETQKTKLDELKNGTRKEIISAQEAQVEAAQASVGNIQAQLSKTILYSPIDGVISKQDIKQGEIVSPNVPVVSVISPGFEIDTYVSEGDISKIKVGNNADTTIDTYGNTTIFKAVVTSIDPAETLTNGISTYKVTLNFTKTDDRIKSGMTANVKIISRNISNALAIPENSIIIRGNDKFVLVDAGNQPPTEQKVTLGIRGSNGFVEIISGLKEGEKVVYFNSK